MAQEVSAPQRRKPAPPRRTRGKPNRIDIHVGARVRQRRTLLGMSQEKLAEALGLTFQQVQKYERGANRIGAGRLYDLSRALDVPVSYFFEDAPEIAEPSKRTGAAEEPAAYGEDPMARRETLLLVRAYYGIHDQAVRRRMLDLMKALGSGEAAKEE